jgi:hypothetical protein
MIRKDLRDTTDYTNPRILARIATLQIQKNSRKGPAYNAHEIPERDSFQSEGLRPQAETLDFG